MSYAHPLALSQFGRLQTGRNPRALTTPTVRSLCASQARIGVGPLPLPGADADIPHASGFVQFAQSLAGRLCVHQGVPAGAARLPATNSDRVPGHPVPQRVRPRATNAVGEQTTAARAFARRSWRTLLTGRASKMQPTRILFSAGVA